MATTSKLYKNTVNVFGFDCTTRHCKIDVSAPDRSGIQTITELHFNAAELEAIRDEIDRTLSRERERVIKLNAHLRKKV